MYINYSSKDFNAKSIFTAIFAFGFAVIASYLLDMLKVYIILSILETYAGFRSPIPLPALALIYTILRSDFGRDFSRNKDK